MYAFIVLKIVLIITSFVNGNQLRHLHPWREDGDYIEYNNQDNFTEKYHRSTFVNEIFNKQQTELSSSPSSLFKEQLPYDDNFNLIINSSSKRLFFQVFKRQSSNVSLMVTLCNGQLPIQLQLYYINSKIIKKFRKRKASWSHRRSIDQDENYLIKMIHRKLMKSHKKLLVYEQVLSDLVTVIGNQDDRFVFHSGLYIIQLNLIDQTEVNRIQMFLSSNRHRFPLYPPLPPVPTIITKQHFNLDQDNDNADQQQVGSSSTTMEILFNPIPDAELETEIGRYEYCLLIQLNQAFDNDQCYLKLDEWSTNGDDDQAKLNDNGQFSHYFKCWSQMNETKLFLHGLQPSHSNQPYYLDVFVRERITSKGSSSSSSSPLTSRYWSTNFTVKPSDWQMKRWQEHFDSLETIHDSLFTGVFLDSKNSFQKRFKYKLSATSNKVYIYVQPCSGLGPIQFFVKQMNQEDNFDDLKNPDQMLFLEELTETRTIELTVPGNGSSYLEFELNTIQMMQTRSIVLLVSDSLQRFPFPRLPQDKSIRAMETLRKCDSITLVWNASPDERVTYCILQRDAKYGQPFQTSISERQLCQKIRPPLPSKRQATNHDQSDETNELDNDNDSFMIKGYYAETTPTRKVLCRRYRPKKRINQHLIMQQVRKLYPGKQYIFTVTIKARQNTLHYEQIWAETKHQDQCYMDNGDEDEDDEEEEPKTSDEPQTRTAKDTDNRIRRKQQRKGKRRRRWRERTTLIGY